MDIFYQIPLYADMQTAGMPKVFEKILYCETIIQLKLAL
jgi:hypothetical protein